MRFLKYSIVPAFLLITHLAFAAEQLPLAVHLDVSGLATASAPRIIENDVLFTFVPKNPARFVGIAFASQNFRVVHPLYKNKHGVFFYLMALNGAQTDIVYRLVVDGLWRSDPENPNTITDNSGIVLSKFVIPPQHVQITSSPIVKPDGAVQFYFKAPPNRLITIAGDFNNWDPFMNRLKSAGNGFYTITLRIAPGTHGYYFVSGGTPIADPLNPRVDLTPSGTKVSVFTVP